MPRCELSGKGPVVKNLVSHSNIKTKSRAYPNIQQKKVYSKTLNEFVSLKLATSTIRDIEHKGGLEAYILNQKPSKLSKRAASLRSRILRKLNAKKKS